MKAREADTADKNADGLHDATHVEDDDSEIAIIERARQAATRLASGQTWADWRAVGRAYWIGHCEAKRRANNNQGRRYASAFHEWTRRVGLDKVLFDKATRACLIKLMENLDKVEAWRKTLPSNKQLEINHPRVVLAHWKRSTVVPDPNKPPKPSAIAKLKQSLADLDEQNCRLRAANGGNNITSRDTARDVVTVLRSLFSEPKLTEIRRLLGKRTDQ
jgi:hypothetical protein